MKLVFLDSGAFFAHIIKEDSFHAKARVLFDRAVADRWSLISTNAIIVEAYALLLFRSVGGREYAIELLDRLDEGFCHLERVSALDESNAREIVRNHEDKSYSLCDALSFSVMERLDIRTVITFDKHFRQYGKFEVLE